MGTNKKSNWSSKRQLKSLLDKDLVEIFKDTSKEQKGGGNGMKLCDDHYLPTPKPWYATHIEEDHVIHIQSAVTNEDNYVCGITYNGTDEGLQEALSNAKLIIESVNYGDLFGQTLDRKLWDS